MPTSSASLNFTPGRSSRVSMITSMPCAAQRFVEALAGLLRLDVVRVQHRDHHFEGRHRDRPDDAVRVVVRFDDRRHHAPDADPVRAHHDRHRSARLVLHDGAELLAVLRAELEDVADLDGLRDAERRCRTSGTARPPPPRAARAMHRRGCRARRRRRADGTRRGWRRSSCRGGPAARRRRRCARRATPTAPRLPADAPSAARISSAVAARTFTAPVASASFCSESA